MSKGLKLLLPDSHGQYIPQIFCQHHDPVQWGLPALDSEGLSPDEDWVACLIGPDHEWYWDAWGAILDKTKHIDLDGNVWCLYQEGDLWAVCDQLMTDEEYAEFFGVCRHCGCNDCKGECFPEAPEEACYVL